MEGEAIRLEPVMIMGKDPINQISKLKEKRYLINLKLR